jgi:hypothetical protein
VHGRRGLLPRRAVASQDPEQPPQLDHRFLARGADARGRPHQLLVARSIAPAEVGRLALRSGVELHELTPQRASREHVFLELTN